MLEKETERLLKTVHEQTIGRGEAVTVKDILAAEIPYPVKVFFRADVERMLREEQSRGMAHSRFTYHHREVESLLRQMNSVLVLNFTFLREEFLQKLEDGVHLVLNYLLRPQWTLTNFVYSASASVSIADIRTMFSYFGAYEYLKEIFFHYAEEKKVETMRIAEFQNLITRIDAEYVRRKSGMEIARLTMPIFEFIHFTPFSSTSPDTLAVDVKALTKFFEDKRFPIVAKLLGQYCFRQNLQGLTLSQLQVTLDEILRANPTALQVEETMIHEMKQPDAEPAQQSQSVEIHNFAPQHAAPRPHLQDLYEMFDEDERKRLLKKIFRKDEAYFTSSLNALNSMTSWKEASAYIDKILIANDVDPYSHDAVRFSEIVYQRFFPKKR